MFRFLLRTIRVRGMQLAREAIGYIAYAISFLRGRSQVRSAWINPEIPLGPKVAVFVHFDRAGRVRPYVMAYLEALRANGFAIGFVSNAGRLDASDAPAVRALCHAVIVRRNIGYDFAAMAEALSVLKLPQANTEVVLIANDSVYGPLGPLDAALARVDFAQADLWGATESWQRRYHLQSFFLLAGRRLLESAAWREFWASVRLVGSKYWVVTRYEVGLTQKLLSAGFSCAALWPYASLVDSVDASLLTDEDADPDPVQNARRITAGRIRYSVTDRLPLNPTAELWRQLLQAGCPFIKRELLRENPAGVVDIADWRAVLRAQGMDGAVIEQDLQRVLKNKVP
jgi:hypothetical protein